MTKVITAAQAAELFKDGDYVATSSFGLAGWAEEVALAVEERFLKTAKPRDITHIHAGGAGNFQGRGGGVWAKEGLQKRLIISHAGSEPQCMEMINENKCEAYNFPLGVILQLYNDIARRGPGVFSKVGLGTFIDPRFDGGRMNELTKKAEDIIELKVIDGEEWLHYKKFPVNVAMIRATTADEYGNLSAEKESLSLELLALAQAAKASGGITIAQVEYLAVGSTIHPKKIKVPGIYVDYVVVAEKPQMQTMVTQYNPAFSGDIRVPVGSIPPMPLNEDKIICRRAAMEVRAGESCNLGIGIPQGTASILAEEGCASKVTLISESGSIGGVPGVRGDFGHHYNIESSTNQDAHFNFYDGGGLDTAIFGLGETDAEGNVNASLLNGKVFGVGGFLNVACNAKKTIIAGTFSAGGLKIKTGDGKLTIEKEGRFKKFLNKVIQISFAGKVAVRSGVELLFITERAVFRLKEEGMILAEIAPGIDLQKDVLDLMEFKPIIPPDLKTMPEGIFKPVWGEGELKKIVEG